MPCPNAKTATANNSWPICSSREVGTSAAVSKESDFRRTALWKVLKADALAGLHFRRQQVIAGFIVDFYCASAQLAIELDGPIHAGQSEEDAERDQALASKGVRMMRIASERVRRDMPVVLEEILAACART